MSYTIVYRSLFVRIPAEEAFEHDRFIPMVLAGDNNVYETSRRRARSWSAFWANKSDECPVAYTQEELTAKVESFLPSSYGEHFVRNGKWVDDDGLRKFFRNGVQNSQTLEEMQESSAYPERVFLCGNDSAGNHYTCRTTRELRSFIENAPDGYITIGFPHENPIYERVQGKKASDGSYYVLSSRGDSSSFLIKMTRSCVYIGELRYAKRFESLEAATKYREKFPKNSKWEIKRIESEE